MNIGKLLFSFDGRISRQSFWIGWVILFLVGLLIPVIPPLWLLLIYPKVCIFNKRLHDMGKSGWLQVIPYIAGLVAFIAGFILFGAALFTAILQAGRNSDDSTSALAILGSMGGFMGLIGLAWLIGMAFLLWVGCTPSQPGGNRYGLGAEGAPVDDVFT